MRKMKKKVVLTLLLIMLAITGCTNEKHDGKGTPEILRNESEEEKSIEGSEENINFWAYTCNNLNEMVPVRIRYESLGYRQRSYGGALSIGYRIENITDKPYKEVVFAILAWDQDGFPLKLNTVDYTIYCSHNNIEPFENENYSNTMQDMYYDGEIEYMSCFPVSYTDFDGNKWINPVMDHIDDWEGKLLEDTPVCYYHVNY